MFYLCFVINEGNGKLCIFTHNFHNIMLLFGDSGDGDLAQRLHPALNQCFCSGSWICVVSSFWLALLQLLLFVWVQFPVELLPDRDTVFSSSNPGNADL